MNIDMAEGFKKLLHQSCTSPTECTCRWIGISYCSCFSRSNREEVLVHSHDLYCLKFSREDSKALKEDLQVKEVLETSASPKSRDWWFLFIEFALYDILPDDPKEAAAIKRKAHRFYYNAIMLTLYCRSHDEILLHCLSHKEAQEALRAHDGMCEAHQLGPRLGERL